MKATPYHSKTTLKNRRPQTLQNDEDWKQVIQELEAFSKDGKTGLSVDLLYRFESQQASQAKNTTGSKTTIQSTRYGRTPTEALLHEREIAHEATPRERLVEELLKMWICTDTACINKPNEYCYVHDGLHLPLTAGNATLWHAKVAQDPTGRLNYTKAPESVCVLLKKARDNKTKARRREQSLTSSHTPTPSPVPPTAHTPQLPPQLPPHYGGYPPYQAPQPPAYGYSYGQVPPPPQLRDVRTHELQEELDKRELIRARQLSGEPRRSFSRTPATTPGPSRHADLLRSSPVEGDIPEFVMWMQGKKPSQARDIQAVGQQLMDYGYTTDQFQGWKDDDKKWLELKMKPSIGTMMARMLSQWDRERGGSTRYPRGHGVTSPRRRGDAATRSSTAMRPGPRMDSDTAIGPGPGVMQSVEGLVDCDDDFYNYKGDIDLSDNELETQG